MIVKTRGTSTPDVAIIGSIHGDEPCGADAIWKFHDKYCDGDMVRTVKTIIANPPALQAGERYIECDPNRQFPGDAYSRVYEKQLPRMIMDQIRGLDYVLSLHSTQSHDRPFVIVDGDIDDTGPVPFLAGGSQHLDPNHTTPIVNISNHVKGSLLDCDSPDMPEIVELECGLQGSSEAFGHAVDAIDAFLASVGATEGKIARPHRAEIFDVSGKITKSAGSYAEVYAENFERVAENDNYASVDGVDIQAHKDFYPVLMSAGGYREILGFMADKRGVFW